MILYHYTAREYLASIARHGLWEGEVPITPTQLGNAVWLTTDPDPAGHGLSDAREAPLKEKLLLGLQPHEKARFPNKRAVRFRIIIPTTDRKLVHWPKWGRRRLDPAWYDTLAQAGGGKAKADTWWLYWGTIPAGRLEALDLETGQPLAGWPEEFSDANGIQRPPPLPADLEGLAEALHQAGAAA